MPGKVGIQNREDNALNLKLSSVIRMNNHHADQSVMVIIVNSRHELFKAYISIQINECVNRHELYMIHSDALTEVASLSR